jgi:hypothetical protein
LVIFVSDGPRRVPDPLLGLSQCRFRRSCQFIRIVCDVIHHEGDEYFLPVGKSEAIVGSHLSGRLVGLGRVGIIGTVGAELMAISCAWFVASERKRVAGVAGVCQVILTAVLLVNASIAFDLDWKETLAGKAVERQLTVEKQAAEERRKTLEKHAELALQLLGVVYQK